MNLSTIKSQFSRRNGLTTIPKTVEVIAAIPENWKKFILPKIRAKPIRTASGVCAALCPVAPLYPVLFDFGQCCVGFGSARSAVLQFRNLIVV